ncbi:MAG: beta-lactamase family protein, partial [Thermoguttaceae bacterium]|nr:beta-lactamase family protein [Thermoguttaceae bacterium]
MFLRRFVLTAALLLLPALAAYAQNLDENGSLPRATPESVGVPSDALVSLIERLDRDVKKVDSVMVLRDGKVIAEAWRAPHAPEKPHAMYSLSKSLCATAFGFAVQEGKISLDRKIVEFFPDDVPADASENLKKIDLESLLSMSCGHEKEPPRANSVSGFYRLEGPKTGDNGENTTWVQSFMAQPVPFEPKTHFCYNTVGTYMAG